jgi:hypothetical protein
LKKGIRIPLHMLSWKPGGTRAEEVVHFVWRIPPNQKDRDENRAFRLPAKCLPELPTYHTRVKKAVFYAEVVNQSFIHSKAAAMLCTISSHVITYPVTKAREKPMK